MLELTSPVGAGHRRFDILSARGGMPSGAELEIGFWLLLAVLGVVGELLTGSFFLLPFAIGAGVAAIAAAFGAELPWVLALFLIVSLSSLFWLRHLARRSEAEAPSIQAGAGRYIDAVGKEMVAGALQHLGF